jgi:CubicO group peptidase (beta-lactamase class C family)
MKSTLLLSFTILILVLKIDLISAQSENRINYFNTLTIALEKQYKKGYIYGFSVAIVNDKGLLYNNGFGYSDIREKKNYDITTLQNIGSVSKTLIGISLLKAQEQGKLLLDDPINKYLPFKVVNPYYPDKEITIRNLATHTSTILDTKYYYRFSYVANDRSQTNIDSTNKFGVILNSPAEEMTMESFLNKLLSKEGEWYDSTNFLNEVPGSKYEYSNVGATLAALILEKATGIKYSEYTQKMILNPLKMNSSGWTHKDIELTNHSVLYLTDGDPIPLYHLVTYPDGGLMSSMEDLGKYLTELIKGYNGEGKLLRQNSYKQLFAEQLTPENYYKRGNEPDDDEYNTGIFMGFTPDGHIGHTGADPGTRVYMFFNPKTYTGRILMINTWLSTEKSAKEFHSIWKTLGKYESLLYK